MFNVNQVSSILEGLDDQALQMQMKSPTAGVPQYMVLAEMQKRQKMRAEAQPPAPAPVTTVAEDIQAQQGGVAALPQMASGEDAPGGIASFAGGGVVDENEWYQFGPRTRYPSGGPGPLAGYWDRVKKQFENSFKMPYPDTPMNEVIGKIPDAGKGAFANAPQYLKDMDTEVGRAQGELLKGVGALDGMVGDSQRYLQGQLMERQGQAQQAKYPGRGRTEPGALPSPSTPEKPPLRVETYGVGDPGTRSSTRESSSATGKGSGVAKGGTGAPGAAELGIGSLQSNAMPDFRNRHERIQDPDMKSAEDYLEKVRLANPDNMGELIARQDQRLAENNKGRNDALAQGLMEAGLGIMAAGAKNGSFLGAIGEGGIGGLKAYSQQMAAVRDRADKIEMRREDLQMQQDALKRGDYKTAQQIADQYNQRALALHGQNVQERRADINYDADMFKTKAMLDKADQDRISREKIAAGQNATTLKAASMRAAAGGGGRGGAGGSGIAGLKPKDYASLIASEKKGLMTAHPRMFNEDMAAYDRRLDQMAANNVNKRLTTMGIGGLSVAPVEEEEVLTLGKKGFYK